MVDMAPSASALRVAVVDDHPLVARGVVAALAEAEPRIEAVYAGPSIAEILDQAFGELDVVLLDLGLPGPSTPEENIGRLAGDGHLVLLHTSEEKPIPVRRALEAGASGLVLKIDPPEAVVAAVREVADGGFACSGPVAAAIISDEARVPELSPRQVEVLALIAEGLSQRQVGRQLGLAEGTVKEYVKRALAAYRKVGPDPGNAHGLVNRARSDGYL